MDTSSTPAATQFTGKNFDLSPTLANGSVWESARVLRLDWSFADAVSSPLYLDYTAKSPVPLKTADGREYDPWSDLMVDMSASFAQTAADTVTTFTFPVDMNTALPLVLANWTFRKNGGPVKTATSYSWADARNLEMTVADWLPTGNSITSTFIAQAGTLQTALLDDVPGWSDMPVPRA
jgi:hypothetical protein